jgi:hypothetical protein
MRGKHNNAAARRIERLSYDVRNTWASYSRNKFSIAQLSVAVLLQPLREVDREVDLIAEPKLEAPQRLDLSVLRCTYIVLASVYIHRPAINRSGGNGVDKHRSTFRT